MARGQAVKAAEVEESVVKISPYAVRNPAHCPRCGASKTAISVYLTGPLQGNRLDCNNCMMSYTWS